MVTAFWTSGRQLDWGPRETRGDSHPVRTLGGEVTPEVAADVKCFRLRDATRFLV